MRWEYEAPFTERLGRLVNLDVAPGFTAVSPVVASDPVGALTGQRYPDVADAAGQARHPAAPRRRVASGPGSSLVVRAGYGIYRNTNVYQSIAMLLAQQPPLSKTFSVENSAAQSADAGQRLRRARRRSRSNTFAVDPDFRVGFAHNWQASVQRDLPASLTVIATYLGTQGQPPDAGVPAQHLSGRRRESVSDVSGGLRLSHLERPLDAARRPAAGAAPAAQRPDRDRAVHAGEGDRRRRRVHGRRVSSGAAIAQDWLDLDAEWGPSTFDQRHLVTAQFQYTTGVGVAGGTLLDGLKGALFKDWTITSQLTTGSGLPLTPVYLTSVAGTGVTGTIRADADRRVDRRRRRATT